MVVRSMHRQEEPNEAQLEESSKSFRSIRDMC